MAFRLIFNPLVPDDLAGAIAYYEQISPALANRFRENIDRRLSEIAERPQSFPMDTPPVRLARIDRFPYLVFFVAKTNFVSVLAIAHGSAEPGKWRDRE